MNLARTQVYLFQSDRRELLDLAEVQQRSMSDLIREAIQEYLVNHRSDSSPLLEMIGVVDSGIPDGAENHDRDIYDYPKSTTTGWKPVACSCD